MMEDLKDLLPIKECQCPQKCAEPTRTDIILEDGKEGKKLTKFTIKNKKCVSIYKVRLDGCLILKGDTSTKRCDFLINKQGSNKILLMEFKSYDAQHWLLLRDGKNQNKVIEQLKAGEEFLKKHLRNYEYKYIFVYQKLGGGSTKQQRSVQRLKRYSVGVMMKGAAKDHLLDEIERNHIKIYESGNGASIETLEALENWRI